MDLATVKQDIFTSVNFRKTLGICLRRKFPYQDIYQSTNFFFQTTFCKAELLNKNGKEQDYPIFLLSVM